MTDSEPTAEPQPDLKADPEPAPKPETKPAPAPEPAPTPAPAPEPAPASAPKQDGGSVYYKNCDAARVAGAAPVHAGDSGYRKGLDCHGDGVGCE